MPVQAATSALICSVVSGSTTFASSLGARSPSRWSASASPSSTSQVENRRSAQLAGAGGGGLSPGLEQVGGEGGDADPVEHRGAAPAVGPGEEAAHAVAVGLHRLGARALGAQVQLPGRKQADEVDGHGAEPA